MRIRWLVGSVLRVSTLVVGVVSWSAYSGVHFVCRLVVDVERVSTQRVGLLWTSADETVVV